MLLECSLVTCRLLAVASIDQASTAECLVRGWRRVERALLRRALEDNPLCQPVTDDAGV